MSNVRVKTLVTVLEDRGSWIEVLPVHHSKSCVPGTRQDNLSLSRSQHKGSAILTHSHRAPGKAYASFFLWNVETHSQKIQNSHLCSKEILFHGHIFQAPTLCLKIYFTETFVLHLWNHEFYSPIVTYFRNTSWLLMNWNMQPSMIAF